MLGGAIDRAELRTNLWFPLNIDLSGSGKPGGGILALIRPEITVYDSSGNIVFVDAPNGEPASVPLLPVLTLLLGLALIAMVLVKVK